MDRFIAAVFPNEASAYAFLSSLKDLDLQGSIELYATDVVSRDKSGQLVRVTSEDAQRGLGTVAGSMLGALIGMFAGPVGLAVGAVAGAGAGFASETAYSGVTGEFISSVSRSLVPGAYAVFAEAYEDWTFPVDDAAREAGGRVQRQATGEVVKAQMKADDEAGREEMARIEAGIGRAQGEAKAKLEAKRDEAKAKHATLTQQRKQRSEEIQKAWDAKIASIKQKADKASSEAKSRHQANAQKLSTFVQREKAALKQMFS